MERNRCPFEKVILSTYGACENASQYYVGERTGVACESAAARNDCTALVRRLRGASRFALKVTDTARELPFGKEMKILFGGLAGLQELMGDLSSGKVDNIYPLVRDTKLRYGALENLPCDQIMKYVAAFKLARRTGPRF